MTLPIFVEQPRDSKCIDKVIAEWRQLTVYASVVDEVDIKVYIVTEDYVIADEI